MFSGVIFFIHVLLIILFAVSCFAYVIKNLSEVPSWFRGFIVFCFSALVVYSSLYSYLNT
jgi:hypothetical protein